MTRCKNCNQDLVELDFYTTHYVSLCDNLAYINDLAKERGLPDGL